MMEDKILIWRFRRGSREALGRIYGKYEGLLVTVAAAILGDRAGAEDVVHDVFLALAQSPDKVGLDGSLRHFLAVCVANRARDRLRARRDNVSVDQIEFLVPEGQQPEAIAAEQEQLQRTWSGLARLAEEQREVVVLHLVAGLRFRQIAANLGISINTAQSRYRYGMEKLRSQLNGEMNE
jgi:RNA polymerase sigma-70 factor (ECF subfamily)